MGPTCDLQHTLLAYRDLCHVINVSQDVWCFLLCWFMEMYSGGAI